MTPQAAIATKLISQGNYDTKDIMSQSGLGESRVCELKAQHAQDILDSANSGAITQSHDIVANIIDSQSKRHKQSIDDLHDARSQHDSNEKEYQRLTKLILTVESAYNKLNGVDMIIKTEQARQIRELDNVQEDASETAKQAKQYRPKQSNARIVDAD